MLNETRNHIVFLLKKHEETCSIPLTEENGFFVVPIESNSNFIGYKMMSSNGEYQREIEPNGKQFSSEYEFIKYCRENVEHEIIGIMKSNAIINMIEAPMQLHANLYNIPMSTTKKYDSGFMLDSMDIVQRIAYDNESLVNTLIDAKQPVIFSAPLSAVYTGFLSPFDFFVKIYGDDAKELLDCIYEVFESNRFGTYLKDSAQKWNSFIHRDGMDYAFFGTLKLFTKTKFKEYSQFVCTIVDDMFEKKEIIIRRLNDKIARKNYTSVSGNRSIEDQLCDILTVFWSYYSLSNMSNNNKYIGLLPTVSYNSAKEFFEEIYFVEDGEYPIFEFRKEKDIKTIIGFDEINDYLNQGYIFAKYKGIKNDSLNFIDDLRNRYPTYHQDRVILFFIFTNKNNSSNRIISFDKMAEAMDKNFHFVSFIGYLFSPNVNDNNVKNNPIYELFLPTVNDYLITMSEEECNAVQINEKYTNCNIIGYQINFPRISVDGTSRSFSINKQLLYRFWSPTKSKHNYATCQELNGYEFEGGCFISALLELSE